MPCRWTRTGWKYTDVDPYNNKFFKNPNRENTFGVRTECNNSVRSCSDLNSFAEKLGVTTYNS